MSEPSKGSNLNLWALGGAAFAVMASIVCSDREVLNANGRAIQDSLPFGDQTQPETSNHDEEEEIHDDEVDSPVTENETTDSRGDEDNREPQDETSGTAGNWTSGIYFGSIFDRVPDDLPKRKRDATPPDTNTANKRNKLAKAAENRMKGLCSLPTCENMGQRRVCCHGFMCDDCVARHIHERQDNSLCPLCNACM